MKIASLLLTLLPLAGSQLAAQDDSPLRLTNLRCEYLRDPEGIDVVEPRLSWELTGEGRSLRQTAWQILAASTPELLMEQSADLWNSGKILSDESAHHEYGGKSPGSARQVYWKARVWDQTDRPSAWSPTARWSTGLLREEQWGGEWIGLDGTLEPSYLRGTSWIVFPDDAESPPTQNVTRYYRRSFVLPAFDGREITRISFLYTGDKSVNGWINGRELGSRDDHRRIKDQDLTFRLQPGENVLALTGSAPGGTVASGGVVALVEVEFDHGAPFRIPTDENWKVSDSEAVGWKEPGFDDTRWAEARKLGPVGGEPWGEVRIAEERRLPARHLRREFQVDKPLRRATLFACGLGWSEFYLNGQRVGDHVLSPAASEYPKRVFYVTHDVTPLVHQGQNALGAVLGNGRYFGPRSIVYASMPTFGFPKLRSHLKLEHTDGSVTEIMSDIRWKLTTEGPIVANNDFDGEQYDARKELGDWSRAGYDDSRWQPAQVVSAPPGRLASQMIEPIRVTERLSPIALTEPVPGVFVFDLGQNMVGWVRLKVAGPAGTVVTLRHAESLLPDGTPSFANLRGARATNTYTLKGNGRVETWEPSFSTQGFRYVEIRGFPGRPDLDAIEGCVVNDDLRQTGTFECSNGLLNQIHSNVLWTVRGNNKSIPMDCPQRDERQAWLGDRSEVARGEAYLFDNAAFYAKWMQDVRDAQRESGSIPDIAPNYWPHFTDNVVWPSTAIIIPNMLLEHYGDERAVADAYESGKRWMNYMAQWVADGIIERDAFGDWCVPPESAALIHSRDPRRQTGKALLATSFFYHDARLMERFARLLGRESDAAEFAALADALGTAFQKKFYDRTNGRYDNGTQTSYVLPLAFGMVPSEEHGRVAEGLVANINEQTSSHIGVGLVGAKHLFRTLSDHGHADLAYTIATQETYPSHGYMISRGATTLWELWNGDTADPWMNSRNHVMLAGDLITWLYGYLAGIRSDPQSPGFRHVLMMPHPVGDLTFVRATYHSIRGPIESSWEKADDWFQWRIRIPPNTTATVFIPASSTDVVTESGRPAKDSPGVSFLRSESERAVYRIGSGTYLFRSIEPPASND